MRTALYTVALSATLVFTGSTHRFERRTGIAQSISSRCAQVLRPARVIFGRVFEARMSELLGGLLAARGC